MKAIITVLPKPTVLDPQGVVVAQTLQHLGLNDVSHVRVGRFIEIELKSTHKTQLQEQLNQACQEFLANPVIEDYTLQISE
ncbi:MAG: phosphoribosylformylglycinamidine synthase [Verrucomicrobia bacterium]|nr:MAG: phosphoribosylformylglycinamidine synthase [Verrucomicrobiota bacterium]